ncbi:hypothetical protein MUP01_06405 [Candidatus Bathyarchaeota archaeon]|jgi:hypothetical protein|nr:hypothetical protein [Candidatus Bathyarchaeota archaeon]
MSWWVYENWTVVRGGKAIVHNGRCSFCRDGKGIHKEDSGKNGKWHGSFESRETAFEYAKALNRARTDFCNYCASFE